METNGIDKNVAKAKKKVEELKGFYIHLTIFIVINLLLIAVKLIGHHYYGDATPIFWGIGLAFHAIKVFNGNPFFSKEWESRQIRKYMEEDQKEAEKYKYMDDGYGK